MNLRKTALALLSLLVFGSITISAQSAVALNLRSINIDCASTNVSGPIYLNPTDSVSINLINCTPSSHLSQLYTDDSGDPTTFYATVTQLTSSNGVGTFELSGDGTFTASNGTFSGPTSGNWLPNRYSLAYLWIDQNYFEFKLIGSDLTQITGSTKLSSPVVSAPSVALLENTVFDSSTNSNYVYASHTFEIFKSGEYFFREISTTPDTFFTDDAARNQGLDFFSPIGSFEKSVGLYSTIDRLTPTANLISAADLGLYEGDFTANGNIFTSHSPTITANLEPGTYTIAIYMPVTIETWNNTNGNRYWGSAVEQSSQFEIWGPDGGLTASTPETLAKTGQSSTIHLGIVALSSFLIGTLIVVRKRNRPTRVA